MATITIKPSDPIQAKINASATGDTIKFDGDFSPSSVIRPLGDRGYDATPNTIFRQTGNERLFRFENVQNITFALPVLFNGALEFRNCSKLTISVPVRDYIRPGHIFLIPNGCGLTDSTIHPNFENCADADTCIFGDTGKQIARLKITAGRFVNFHEAVHFWQYGQARNKVNDLELSYNVLLGGERHPYEIQGSWTKIRCYKNYFNNWARDTKSTMAISMAVGGDPGLPDDYRQNSSYDVHIFDNVIGADGLGMGSDDAARKRDVQNRWSQYSAVEVMGDDTQCYRNTIKGWGIVFLTGQNGPNTNLYDNTIIDMQERYIIVGEDQFVQPKNSGNTPVKTNLPLPPPPDGSPPPPPPPPPSKMKVTPTAYTSFVRVLCEGTNSGNTVLEWRGGDGVWKEAVDKATGQPAKITALPVTIDAAFDPVKYKNWWVWFRLRDATGTSPEAKANEQIGQDIDPGAPPPPPPPPVTKTRVPGNPFDIEHEVDAGGNVVKSRRAN